MQAPNPLPPTDKMRRPVDSPGRPSLDCPQQETSTDAVRAQSSGKPKGLRRLAQPSQVVGRARNVGTSDRKGLHRPREETHRLRVTVSGTGRQNAMSTAQVVESKGLHRTPRSLDEKRRDLFTSLRPRVEGGRGSNVPVIKRGLRKGQGHRQPGRQPEIDHGAMHVPHPPENPRPSLALVEAQPSRTEEQIGENLSLHEPSEETVEEVALQDIEAPHQEEEPLLPSGDTPSSLSQFLASPGGIDNSGLVEARPVPESNEAVVGQAQQVDPEVLQRRSIQQQKEQQCRRIGYAIILVSAVIITLAVVLRKSSPTELEATKAPTPTTLSPTTAAPTPVPVPLIGGLQSFSLNATKVPGSPQEQAFDWVTLEHQDFEGMDEWRKRQLFSLATFYYAFNQPSILQGDWLEDDRPECDWFSDQYVQYELIVSQNEETGEVERKYVPKGASTNASICFEYGEWKGYYRHFGLHIPDDLQGRVPPEIVLLEALENFHLIESNLNASFQELLPWTYLHRMANLTSLDFSLNGLVHGSIPRELWSMTGLKNIRFINNKIGGILDDRMANLKDLVTFYAGQNAISGNIPSVLGLLTHLAALDLAENRLTGTLPTELGELAQMEGLFLSLRDKHYPFKLSGTLPTELGRLLKIRNLSIDNQPLTGTIPTEIFRLSHLTRFGFGNNAFSGTLATELGQLTDLEYMFISNLDGTFPSEIGRTRLLGLDLDFNHFHGPIPSQVGLLESLEHLILRFNAFTGTLPSELEQLTNLQLVSLVEGENSFSGALSPGLLLLPKLESFSISENSFTGTIPTDIGKSSSLRTLSLGTNQLQGPLPSQLGMLSNTLVQLHLSWNLLTGSIPTELSLLTNLRELSLFFNQISGTLPTELGAMTNLGRIYVNYNQLLVGTVPSELGLLTALTRLYIDSTGLSGEIPPQVCALGSLTSIHLTCEQVQCGCGDTCDCKF